VRAQPLIAVRDVKASSTWYPALLGLNPYRLIRTGSSMTD